MSWRKLAVPALIFSIASTVNAEAEAFTGRVVGVHDGDTATILTAGNQQVKCRLGNIDAPELHQSFGNRAKQALSDLVYGQTVQVEDEGGDRYGRRICMISTPRGQANREMVRVGMAWVYTTYNHDQSLPALQLDAQTAHRGLWADPHPVPPWEYRHSR
jgi:micrococcal nuclease